MGPFLNEGAVLRGYTGGADLFDREGRLLLKTRLVNNILVIDTAKVNSINAVSAEGLMLLHKQLGHPGKAAASKMLPGYNFSGVDCNSCLRSKGHCLPFPGQFPLSSNVLEVIHMDVCGPINPATRGGNRFIFQIIDGHSRMSRNNSSSYSTVHSSAKSDSGKGELDSVRENTGSSAQLLVSSLNFQTPISKWVAPSPSTGVDHLHPFGCTAIIHFPKERRSSKVGPTGVLCMFLGNVEGHRNFRLYDPQSGRILITHDCTFKDSEAFWPLYSSSLPSSSLSLPSNLSLPADLPVVSVAEVSEDVSSPEVVEALCDEGEDESTEAVEVCLPQPVVEVCPPQPVVPLEKPLPKGWTYEPVAETAPKDVTSSISMDNVVSGRFSREAPN
ncbi:hypothetical protein O181_067662 [Austropuccinia psidii MF-1]|uniref:Retroviral polymerase SH3-like domain-containing protein n=1 Tax=Austropuccinia psidii MF-1 TaxID=1389203 RepID=A0A9Q3EXU0_9BASI|nr:hypothetical protein [Austropuccinia psidii MF-1]